ncbi:MAG TPA: phosphoribosylformylglycinamidine synthase subunit PurQ, partial [Thermoplasmata archaeon]|nr:phosphoribosylformylglycinamidine synthase subunit PurQ [Thermoplasmata archaeon]
PELEEFLHSGHLLGGICNGFQVLTELGLLPGRPGGRLGAPEAALLGNDSGHFECRPTYLRSEGRACPAFATLPASTVLLTPSAHAEGKLVLGGDPNQRLRELEAQGQVLFRYVRPDGVPDGYPWNPNGSIGGVAGLASPDGNVFGVMPHPERAFFRAQHPDWTRTGGAEGAGDGRRFFEPVLTFLEHHG